MNNIEEDVMIKRLADFLRVDLATLTISDENEEKKFIAGAHKIDGYTYDEITHFFSRIELPEFIDKEWIFKALKYNDAFYIQNIALIRATEWKRQEVYNKYNREKEEKNNKNFKLDKQKSIKIIKKVTSEKQPDNSIFTRYKSNKNIFPAQAVLKRAASDESFNLPEIYKHNLISDFEIYSKKVYPCNNTHMKIVIIIKPADIKVFVSENPIIYINIFEKESYIDSIKPETYKEIKEKNEAFVEIKCLVAKSLLDGCAWGLSNIEPIDLYF